MQTPDLQNYENTKDLYLLRDKLLAYRNSIEASSYVSPTPYCGIKISFWEEMMRLIDEILISKPKLTKIKNWKIGEHFYSSRFPDVVYTIIGFPSYRSLKGQADTFGMGIPSIIEEHESLCFPYSGKPPKNVKRILSDAREELIKSEKQIEKEDNLKRKKKNKPEKGKKKFQIGITATKNKKGEKKAKKHLKNENLFESKKGKKKNKKK